MSSAVEILGRDIEGKKKGSKGCAYLGKVVSYPGGEYEEIGQMFLDISGPHCMLILGKRGTGKSYTLGVLAEEFGRLEDKLRQGVAVVIIDTMSVFHSLKKKNINKFELGRMKNYTGVSPKSFENCTRIFIPEKVVTKLKKDGVELDYDGILKLSMNDLEPTDWLSLFSLKPTEPSGSAVIRVINSLQSSDEDYGFSEIFDEVSRIYDGNREIIDTLYGLFKMAEKLNLFKKDGLKVSDIVKSGYITVLDISYLGRLSGFDARNLIVAIIARKMMQERTFYTTVEMQHQAGMVKSGDIGKSAPKHPLVYMMIDEAHLFLPSVGETLATKPLIDWIKLGRHPGLSLILATQEPSALHESAIRQADIMVAHNLTSNDDLKSLEKARQSFMKGKDLKELVGTMESRRGLAIVFDDKTRKMLYCRVRPRMSLHTGLDANLFAYANIVSSGSEKRKKKIKILGTE